MIRRLGPVTGMMNVRSFDFELSGERIGTIRSVDTDQQTEMVYSMTPEPDPNWEGIDGHGHEHVWDVDRHKPTGTIRECDEPYWCDTCRDEHQPCWWACIWCGEHVTPGTRGPSPYGRPVVISRSTTVTVDVAADFRLHGTEPRQPAALIADDGERIEGTASPIGVEAGSMVMPGRETILARFDFVPSMV